MTRAAALAAAAAVAFVMPAWSVLKRLVHAREELDLSALQATGALTTSPAEARAAAAALGIAWSPSLPPLQATLSVRLPGRCRLDVAAPEGDRSVGFVWAQGRSRVDGGGPWPALQQGLAQACALVALRPTGTEGESRQAIDRHLAALKVDTRRTSLARFEGAVNLVVGERAEGAASLWVYKDRFQPARVLWSDESGRWDVRLVDYGSYMTGDWLPRVIAVYRDGELAARLSFAQATDRPRLDGVRF